jgi:hypothetical protein
MPMLEDLKEYTALYEKETENIGANDHRGARKPMTFPCYKQRNNLERLN